MRNIFLFIRRYFTFIAFIALQAIALSFLFKYNKFHRATFLGVANEITGSLNTQVDQVDDFFHLREENERVHRVNDSLLNLLKENFLVPDTNTTEVIDTARYFDTLPAFRRYLYRDAKVVSNSVNAQKNYIQINRGARHGIKDNMAVINSDLSAVGLVVNVSENFSQVMSLLHMQSRVNAVLKKTGDFGTIEWDGKDPRFVILRGIPKSIPIQRGDSVITSINSNFPPGKMVGRIDGIIDDKTTNFYILKVRTTANFLNLQQVFVVENMHREEQVALDNATRKKVDQVKKTGS